ncbi:hypothetical protein K0M31_013352 [Melipona bicolor]|uniref:Uncharacterized protein n=1 Tax=Melipona bicolor TaxID=60889 RepID=A0AA40FI46_9HYME|nr:hypothetical protein K0M31_013352 [Melipona bicolor]
MDLNVCSRRVHDGYATIRSRGRSRPRAVYRSDSEELLKEAGGPYALPQLSNFPVVVHASNNDLQQVPRWSDFGKDCLLIENYGTLRGSKKGNPWPEGRRLVTLNTFSKVEQGRGDLRVNGQGQPSDALSGRNGSDERKQELSIENGTIDRVYDDVCAEERGLRPFQSNSDAFKDRGDPSRFTENHFRPVATLDSDLKRLQEIESNAGLSARRGVRREDARFRRIGDAKGRQPIYAVPSSILSRSRRDRRVAIVDGNYVPSGDLYRTTAKYIEDINKNIAEIDKSYEELKSSSSSRNSSTYGVINRIAKGEMIDRTEDLCGYARKRDMAPMPPISCDFGESLFEKQSDSDVKTESLDNSVFTLKSSRPNSFGKHPPKLLPRSSSIENTSRHSTGSTTTSSTKSTESLYAISEVGQSGQNGSEYFKSGVFQNGSSKNPVTGLKQDPASTEGSDELESKDEMSSTDDDRPTIVRSVDRLPVTSSIRKNRSRVDPAQDKSYSKRDRLSTCQVTSSVRRSNDLVARGDKNFYKSQPAAARSIASESGYSERRYDTLPTRRSRATSRPLHKSSEDVLDGERLVRARSSSLHRPCISDVDVSERNDERLDNRRNNLDNFFGGRPPPLYLMDATDVIMRGQLDRTSRGLQWQDHLSAAKSSCRRTRHNSLESEESENKDGDNRRHVGGFATLPRRGNLAKDQPSNDPLRRLSGNVPILEPLYEHAVSDPVKPRSTENVIPWWELATRKYRHRSCPSLQLRVGGGTRIINSIIRRYGWSRQTKLNPERIPPRPLERRCVTKRRSTMPLVAPD